MTDRKPYRHRFPLSVIGYALRLYRRCPLSQRDVQELLHERGIQVSHETLRQWHINFAPPLTEELRHPLSFEFVVQQPIPSGRVVQGDLPDFLLHFIPLLLAGTARRRAVLMIP
ncbi:hypothetical protein J2Y00_004583 [Deinococcus soli (ex Cha et al. 2016)]|uniref:Uncharacterized protein n=2 Tax=Deinococcus soli (ex Cha et al. 2016) TaxID=1309411 RepID=A0ACC6KME3_9DEIO|nr:hypothetical protein [Deinococcus soli (ex Cha et al. 2016)]MDR6330946.1 hypothetical protein [Deinococcus soli (ex Cha et al. 2016)]MDR6753675.1 hypothetical protein [Deinococcus soli (ex Cha et al. 2016)]